MTASDLAVQTHSSRVTVDVLDVGHGSCVVVRAGNDVALIDTGSGGAVLEYMFRESIAHIHTVLLSHSDSDHAGGLSGILSQGFVVDNIVWNGDAYKRSSLWSDLVYQLRDLQRHGSVVAEQDAFPGLTIELGGGSAEIRVLAPDLVLRRIGAGGRVKDGRSISSNSVSVVAQVRVRGEGTLFVPGDLDRLGFEHLVEEVDPASLKSRYLILPHHGGLLGTAAQTVETIRDLTSLVGPELVVVSNGRTKYGNPRADVVEAVRKALPTVPIICTQLSTACARNEIVQPSPENGPYSAGWARGHACGGTLHFELGRDNEAAFDRSRHIEFLERHVPDALCGTRSLPESSDRR